ncbi:MAG: YeeE/YedE family protein [Pseudomonadota bacterium]
MENFTPYSAMVGGALIGLSATLLMLLNGRIAGISGILGASLKGGEQWQWWFLAGLILGAGVYVWTQAPAFAPRTDFPLALLIPAGLLVGLGTRLGSGCTSGHGVCGMVRFSVRSISATMTFLAVAIATVYIMRHVLGVTA